MENISTGAGIFYGLLVLSFVILIVKTKDTWKWGRIFSVIIGLPILAIGVIMGIEYYNDLPKKITQVGDLSLGATPASVAYWIGEPVRSETREFDSTYTTTVYQLASNDWIIISYKEETARRIIYHGEYNSKYNVNNLWVGISEAAAIKRLGGEYEVYERPDNSRCYVWRKFNTLVNFKSGTCTSVGILSADFVTTSI